MDTLNNRPVTITFSDGMVKEVIFESFESLEGGEVLFRGRLSDGKVETPTEEPKESPAEAKPYIRSYLFRSGLVRFLHEGSLRTAAITHCTDKAWRVMNRDLGVTWIPKSIIRWSEIAQQFCVIDETYEFDFTFSVSPGMDEYPSIFNPESIVSNELE